MLRPVLTLVLFLLRRFARVPGLRGAARAAGRPRPRMPQPPRGGARRRPMRIDRDREDLLPTPDRVPGTPPRDA